MNMKKKKISRKKLADYHLEPAEFKCVRCGAEVKILHSKTRPDLAGMYCNCRYCGDRAEDLPTQKEW
jgi:DNA-directed RNA polymerase subunit RPC12/RpoP